VKEVEYHVRKDVGLKKVRALRNIIRRKILRREVFITFITE